MSEASLRFSLNERSTEAASFLSYKNKKGLNIEIPCDMIHNNAKEDLSMTKI